MRIQRKALLNTVAGSSANLKADLVALQNVLCNDNTADPLVNILPPIPYTQTGTPTNEAAVEEVVQLGLVGLNGTTHLVETVVAGRSYKIKLDSKFETRESEKRSPFTYNYTAPNVLVGTNSTDLFNMYTSYVARINAYADNNVEAKLVQKVPFTVGATAAPAVGAVVTEAGTSSVGTVAYVHITSGTFAGGDAVGFFYLYDYDATFQATGNYSWAGGSADTGTIGLLGQAMLIQDDANYWVPSSTPTSLVISAKIRVGATTITVCKYGTDGSNGFDTSEVAIVQTAVYSKGKGAHMLRWVPTFSSDGMDKISGDVQSIFTELPVDGTFYTKVTIPVDKPTNAGDLADTTATTTVYYEIYLAQDSASSVGTNATALAGSIVAMS